MKVKELIELLSAEFPDDEVVLAIDEEGNGFSSVNGISKSVFDGEYIYLRELTPELETQGFTEEDMYTGEDGKKCVVLWP